MPIETRVLPGLIWITIRGEATTGDFGTHALEMARIERDCDVSPNRFTDLSESSSHPDYDTMAEFARTRSKATLKNNVKSAVFAPKDLHFGMARMFQNLNRNPQIELKIFRDQAEALEWVGWKGT